MGKFWRAFVVVALILAAGAGFPASAADIKTCLADLQHPLQPNDVSSCAKLAADASIAAPLRARIFLQLAIAESIQSVQPGGDFAPHNRQALAYADAGIAVYAHYDQLYAFAANLPLNTIPDHLLSWKYTQQGLRQNPHSAILLALHAYYATSNPPAARVQECRQALHFGSNDQAVLTLCGQVNEWAGKDFEAKALLGKAANLYRPNQRVVYGVFQFVNPWFALARVQAKGHRPLKAAQTIQRYFRIAPNEQRLSIDYLDLGTYLAQAGQYGKAAKAFADAAALPLPIPAANVHLKQMTALIMAGDTAAAEKLSESVYASGEANEVLQLQVALRNAGKSNTPINGSYDDATRAALKGCLQERTCHFQFDLMPL